MDFMVPFDGGNLSKAALWEAHLCAVLFDEAPRQVTRPLFSGGAPEVVAVSVIPESQRYARKKGWTDQDEAFRHHAVAGQLHEQVTDIAPGANFQSLRADKWDPPGTIASKLRRKANDLGVTDLFVGSENAGRVVTPLTSVGSQVATDQDFNVHIVRRKRPPKTRKRIRTHVKF